MDQYNALLSLSTGTTSSIRRAVSEALLYLRPEILAVDSPLDEKELAAMFPEEGKITAVHYTGSPVDRYLQFVNEFPNEWELLIDGTRTVFLDVISRYKIFWDLGVDSVYLPATCGSLEISGHLLFMNYFSFRRLQKDLSLEENLYDLSLEGIKINGIHGVFLGRRDYHWVS